MCRSPDRVNSWNTRPDVVAAARLITSSWDAVSGVPGLARLPIDATVAYRPPERWATPTVAPFAVSGVAIDLNSGEFGPATATALPKADIEVVVWAPLALRYALSSVARSSSS